MHYSPLPSNHKILSPIGFLKLSLYTVMLYQYSPNIKFPTSPWPSETAVTSHRMISYNIVQALHAFVADSLMPAL